jgi:hypothetical protein
LWRKSEAIGTGDSPSRAHGAIEQLTKCVRYLRAVSCAFPSICTGSSQSPRLRAVEEEAIVWPEDNRYFRHCISLRAANWGRIRRWKSRSSAHRWASATGRKWCIGGRNRSTTRNMTIRRPQERDTLFSFSKYVISNSSILPHKKR